jgi:uncharacterized protein YecE (DUF72 family)
MEGNVFIGTSGWVYKHWKEIFYPGKMPASKWLHYYSSIFPVTEINNCFYRLPSQETVLKWMAEVPKDFLFCPKMSRFLTHMKKLRDPEEPLERFFSVFEVMKKQMGPVLIQLPHMVKFNYEITEHFYRLLKFEYGQYRFVMEVRHESWMEEKSLTLMTKYDIGFVISHSAGFFPYLEMVTAEDIYLRLHGPAELYASSYSDDELLSYAKKIRKWKKEGHKVWVFFNNDIHGYAVPNAQKLMQLVQSKRGKA